VATIIDALIVTLGLDPTDYKKGEADAAKATATTGQKLTDEQKKQAAARKRIEDEQRKRAKQTADEEKKRADATVKGFKDIAISAAGLVLGFDSIKGFVSLLGTLNSNEAGLGRLGQNLGVNVHELNTWGIAAEQIGGKAEDIQASFANVSKSITDLQVSAQVSPLFLLAQRLGLDIRHVTDKTKFLLDLGDKLRAYAAKHGRDSAFNISGLDATTYNLITSEDARKRLADAERINHVNEDTAKQAAESQKKIEALKQRGLNVARDVGHTLTPLAVNAATSVMDSTGDELDALNAAAHGDFKIAWQNMRHAVGLDGVVTDKADNQKSIRAAEQAYGLNPGSLDAIARIESNYDPLAVNPKSGATGLMQLMPGTFGGDVGKDTKKDIDTAAKEFARLVKHYNGDYVKAAEAYNWGQGNLDHFLRGDINKRTGKLYEMPEETKLYGQKYAAAIGPTPGARRGAVSGTIQRGAGGAGGGNVTNVTVGAVTVNTQATDAQGTAAGLAGAIRRQSYAAQANTGQTQ
jgi:hypothetical protein